MTKKSDLFTRRRQSPWAVILILLKMVRLIIRQLWPILLIMVLNRGDRLQFWLGVVSIGAAAISLIGSMISYFRFYYYVDGDQLHIEKGLLRRTSIDIPFTRIQTVDFEQNVIHQALNVVRVNVDSAGSKSEEIAFDALTMEDARELRDFIMLQKAEQAPEEVEVADLEESEELILALKPKDLLKIGISQNHLRTAGIIFGASWALLDNISQALQVDLYDEMTNQIGTLIAGSIIIALLAIPLFLILSFIVTLFRTVLRYYNLRFTHTPTRFKLVAGLLNRKEKSAQRNKIQIISWSSNPIRRLFGIFHLRLYQASSVEVLGGKSFIVPGCYQEHVDKTIDGVIPGAREADYKIHGIHPLARWRFVLFTGLLPCVLFSVAAVIFQNWSLFAIWIYFPLSIYMAQLYYRKRKLHLSPDYCVSASGIFGHQYRQLELYKVQSVRIRQSYYQVRRNLATLVLYTASGDVRFPYIELERARELKDYVLYRIESDKRGWM